MVFESVVAELLNRFLGDYIHNFDSSQLKVGIFNGDVSLQQLDVKESAFDDLDLPVKVVSGRLEKLILKIPWRKLYTAPVIANIEGLFIVVVPSQRIKYDEEKEKKAAEQAKLSELQRIEQAKAKHAEKADPKDVKKQDSFTEKLVAQIVKNLQVTIRNIHIRYEDNFTDPKHPFAVGFTLHSLSFQTTDEKWNPCIIQDEVNIIYKLITLESLAVYVNCESSLFADWNTQDRQKAMEMGVATPTHKPEDSMYLLGPINSRAQLQINQKPESDGFKLPKVWVNVVMDEIAVGLSQRQYQDLMKLLDALERMTVASLYRKYHPNVPHLGHEKEWWKFAIAAVLEENVRRKRQNWNWLHMKHHRNQCKTYKELYTQKLNGKKLTQDVQNHLCECERSLDLFNITVVRKQAELEALKQKLSRSAEKENKKTWSAWFSGYLPRKEVHDTEEESTEKKIARQIEKAMTPEEKAKLYDAIGYQEQVVVTEFPQDFVATKMVFTLHNLTMFLSDDSQREKQVLKANLKEVFACMEQRPAAQAMSLDAKIQSFVVNGVPTLKKTVPTLVSSQQTLSCDLPLLRLFFETNPIDGTCDHRLHVNTQPLEIIYDAITINSLAKVFKPPEEITLQQLQSAALMKLEDLKEMSAFGLQYAIEQHKYLDLKVDMQPTFIIIPENGILKENITLLVVSLGRFKMGSTPGLRGLTVRNMVRSGSSDVEVKSTMIENAYDKFCIEVQNAEIILSSPEGDWKSAIGCNNDPLHLLMPVSIQIDLHKSIITSRNPHMPQIRVVGELVLLNICISDQQLYDLLKLISSIPLPEGDAAVVPEQKKDFAAPTSNVGIVQATAKAVQVARKEAVSTLKDSGSENDSDGDELVSQSTTQQTEMEIEFEIKKFAFTLMHQVQKINSELLKFGIDHFGIGLKKRTYDLSADLYLGGIVLEYPEFKVANGKPLKLLTTPVNETEEHLFILKYLSADKKAPDFVTLYNSTLQSVNMTFRSINVVLHQEAILSLMGLANELLSNMESISSQAGVKAVKSTASAGSQKTFAKDEKNILQKAGTIKKRTPSSNVIDMEIKAEMDSIGVIICNCDYDVTNIQIEGLKSAVILQKSKTCVNASLKDLVVCDPRSDAVYRKILSTIAGEVLSLKVSVYNDATDDDNYADTTAVDMSIAVSFGRMKIFFLNKFVASLLLFLDHFQEAKQKVAEASVVAAEAAKHGMEEAYDKASRVLLDICIQAPVIIVPQNSSSKNAIVADLGILKIFNKFQLGVKRNELGVPVLFDKMTLDLQSLQLSRALIDPEAGRIKAECLLLEPISFCLTIKRNLSSGWYKDEPEVDIYGALEAVKVALSQDDYSTVMSVLNENLSETPEANTAVELLEAIPAPSVQKVQIARDTENNEANKKKNSRIEITEIVQRKITAQFKFQFQMNSFCGTFYSGETTLIEAYNKRDPSKSIARIELQSIDINATIMSDNSKTANVVLCNTIFDDTRVTRKSGITRIMERTSSVGTDSMINIEFVQDVSGENKLGVRVSSFSLVVSLSYLMKLAEFFTSTSTTQGDSASNSETLAAVEKPPPKTSIPQSTTIEELSTNAKTIITLQLEQPDIVLIEDIENQNSDAIFLNNEFSARVILTETVKDVSGTISNLTFYTACFNKEMRNSTMARILSPCDIDLHCNMRDNVIHMDVLFKDLILHISPGTVQLITNIMSSLFTETTPEAEVVEKVQVDFSALWLTRKLEDCHFWFLETVKFQNATEALEDLLIPSTEDNKNPSTNEQLLFTMRKVVITIEAGVGSRTVPMILLESSFQAHIQDWSTSLYIGSSLGLEVSYYNERIAIWEPLVEPVETTLGHRSWELMMEISKQVSEAVGDLSPDDEDSPDEVIFQPPLLTITIMSVDVMQLTVSKCALEVLSHLGQAFGEAVKHTMAKEIKYPQAPYQIQNYFGIPVTILLDEGFEILNEKDNGYTSVTIESRAPPCLLVYKDPETTTKTRLSVLKKQDLKEDVCLSIKINFDDIDIVRKISVACTDKRFFHLPKRTYPGDKWGFIIDVQSAYGCKLITFQSILQVHNHFSIPFDVYYMMSALNELKGCATVKPNAAEHIPVDALYTSTSELFFKPKDEKMMYTLTLEPFVWKELIDNPSAYKIVQCKYKQSGGQPFYINVAGNVERIFFEETGKKTMASSLYKIHLYPSVVLRNLLMYPISYSLQGVNKDCKLMEGESNELWTAEIGETGLEIRLLNYLDRNWVCYKNLKSNVEELSVWIFETQIGDTKAFLELGMHTQKKYGPLIMQLYAPFVMINKTGLLLTYRRDEDNTIAHPPNLDMPVLFSFKAKSFFAKKKASLKIHDSEWSEKFSIDAVGSSGTVAAKNKDGQTYGIGVQIKPSQAGLTKIIVFTPFYLLVNNCEFDIECQELEEKCEWVKIPKTECIPFWPKNTSKGQMVARYSEDCKNETPAFSFKDHHSTLMGLKSERGGLFVECQVSESSVILTFEDYKQGNAAALLVNHMEQHSVTFHQSGCKKEIELHPGSCVLYTWENPLEKRIFSWKCGLEQGGTHDLIKDGIGDFIPAPDATAYWVLFLDGMQRVLMFTDDLALATAAQEAGELERIEQEVTIKLQGLGISLVDNDAKRELMYMGITSSGVIWESKKVKSSRFKPLSVKDSNALEEGFQRFEKESKINKAKTRYHLDGRTEVDFNEMMMKKPLIRKLRRSFETGLWAQYKTSPHQVQLHAKINRIQMDNQLVDCVFPVVLAPVPPPKSVVAENAPKPFTELSIMLRKAEHSSVQQFKYCKMLIQEFHVKLDQGFINSTILFFTPDEPVEINYVKSVLLDKELVEHKLKDVASVYSSQDKKSYFDILHFSPLKVHISFSMTGGGGGQKEGNNPTPIRSDFLNLLLQSVGVTLTEIQDVIFKLDYFERQFVFMSQKQLISEATSHYIGQTVKQLYMLVLGLDVIGNPVGLILGIGEGVTDLFYEPFQGAIQGPEEFAEGLALGVKSLFGHAIGGAAGAASRITGTLGKGIAALTLDKEFQQRRRQNINRRPQDIRQGLAQSGKGLVMGVFEGVTGIVTKPLEGAREEGVGGFFKGIGKGVIGIVTRPTAGVVDFASGSFEAVKRAAELSDEIKRLRPPRFIKPDGVIRPYVKNEAEGNKLLQEVEKGRFANTDVYHAHAPVGTDDKTFLLVTNNRLMYVTKGDLFGQWNVEWHYRWNEIKGVPCITEKGLQLMLKEPHKKKMNIFGSKVAGKIIHISDKQILVWIVSRIEEIMKKPT